MTVDRLDSLLQRFSVSARMFHSGPLCGVHDFALGGEAGQLHLVRRGPLRARHAAGASELIDQPSLLFYPRPLHHRFEADADVGADMACANVCFGVGSPLLQALPAVVVMPLSELAGARNVLDLLFEEAFAKRCGRQPLVDRLFEVVLILILRHLLERGRVRQGALAGLAHPRLARALVAMHESPAHGWTLQQLAAVAGMSRSRFAELFAAVVGSPPAAYLAAWRISLAQDQLRRGRPLTRVADEVGYGSTAALSRAFSAHCGRSPRAWLKLQVAPTAARAQHAGGVVQGSD
jgi:AraC-like DNA-binding protein